jgi:hypothetical protein
MTKNTTTPTRASEAPARTAEDRLTRLPDEQLVQVQGAGWRFQRDFTLAEDPPVGSAAL